MAVGLYDAFLAFDRVERKAWAIGVGERGERTALKLLKKVTERQVLPPISLPALELRSELTRDDYLDRVTRVIEYIRAGDIFQANFTVRFLADRPDDYDVFALYRRLRKVNPAPFAAFLRVPGLTLASASPERFLSLDKSGRIEARPIKGTKPRFADPEQDKASGQALKASVKDNAENLMIVDLLRNDIGRVAAIGSVKVPVLSGLESFASVHHLVSVITGQLRPGLGPVDLLRASFPGGSITGAPKVRAMEIIDELEPAPRGAYCGSVLWIGFDGAMDSNIVIRTIVSIRGKIVTQAGGGIVSDSNPEAEWDEMMTKIQPALNALKGQ
jgi:para-aminobenzoate synthetase component 1